MSFSKYIQFKEESQDQPSVTSKIKLQKGAKQFGPFTINKNNHSNLRYIVKAFGDSSNVGVGYTTIDKSKGETEPTLKKKSLYLTGGAVRDHLKGKTPRNYDLVTDATPSEIRLILRKAEYPFTEVKPHDLEHAHKYQNLPLAKSKNRVFYASRWDGSGKELEFTVEVNGEKFNLATLSKSSKSRYVTPENSEAASSIEEDSQNRDFTINALYIPLTTADGDNSELLDPHGGAHHLKNNQIVAVNDDLDTKLKDDPGTSMRCN